MSEVKKENMNENVIGIVVDDGSQRIPIRNKQGDELGVFYFRPTDVGIIDRYNRMADSFEQILTPLEDLSINSDGSAGEGMTPEEIAALNEAERRLYDAVDTLFGGNMSEAFFGKMHPFSPINGEFYCETAIDAVGKYISAQFNHETKNISKKVRRYTDGYMPKKKTGGGK